MNHATIVKSKKTTISPNKTNGKKEIVYPEEEPKEKSKLGETDYQHIQISILETMLRVFFGTRKDIYLASDLFFYYEEGNPRRRVAPDIMICFGVENKLRRTYQLWKEKVVPSVIIEIASNATWEKDLTTRKRIYEKLGIAEYYIFDPEYKYLPAPLIVYHLKTDDFLKKTELIPRRVFDNRIFSPILGLDFVDTGNGLRLFNPETSEFLPTIQELADSEILKNVKIAELEAEIARLKGLQK